MLVMNAGEIIFLTFFKSVFCEPEPGCIDVKKILFDEEFCSSVSAYMSHVAAEKGENCKKYKKILLYRT